MHVIWMNNFFFECCEGVIAFRYQGNVNIGMRFFSIRGLRGVFFLLFVTTYSVALQYGSASTVEDKITLLPPSCHHLVRNQIRVWGI